MKKNLLKVLSHPLFIMVISSAVTWGIIQLNIFVSAQKLQNLAQSITVEINKEQSRIGPGTIIAKQGNKYLVISNAHVILNSPSTLPNSSVLLNSKSFQITTFGEQNYEATLISNPELAKIDLGLLEFTSNQNFPLANIANSLPEIGEKVIAAGFVTEQKTLNLTEGEIKYIPEKPFQKGYQIGYTNTIEMGMSGGPIINTKGELIGLNGKRANPIYNSGFIYEDNSKPPAIEVDRYRQVSWGIPSVIFFTQIR
jgi:S1-C subfamily serine protease